MAVKQIDAASCGHFALRLVRSPAGAVCAASLRTDVEYRVCSMAHFYGFETTSEFFKIKKLDTHLVKMKDGVLYMCFGDEPVRPIHRLDRDPDGAMRVMWACGAWADAGLL